MHRARFARPLHHLQLCFHRSRPQYKIHCIRSAYKASPKAFTRLLCAPAAAQGHEEASGAAYSKREDLPQSAYVHLPFCKKRCFYCDFPIQAVGNDPHAPQIQSTMQQYVDVLCREIQATDTMETNGLRTIFFGGGTPSLIPPDLLAQILDCLQSKFKIEKSAEVSMEADPGTFTADSLCRYMSLGVNRFSIGIQAFQQEVLERCGRSHGIADVYKAIEDVHQAGVSNWSLDLISGLPYTDLDAWKHSLEEALQAGPTHISVYDLQVEEKTKFGKLYAPGQFPLPTDDNTARMFCMASEALQAGGMEHYEISSYAKPGHRCQHNQVYWGGAAYHAFGLGAASYIRQRRFSRPRSMAAYKAWVSSLEPGRHVFPGQHSDEEPSETDHLLDTIMLRLRLSDGLDLGMVEAQYGKEKVESITKAIKPHVQQKLVRTFNNSIALADPAGFMLSNDIISDVFAELDQE